MKKLLASTEVLMITMPRKKCKDLFSQNKLSTSEEIAKFSKKFLVSEDLVKDYVRHLTDLKRKADKRKEETKKKKQIAQSQQGNEEQDITHEEEEEYIREEEEEYTQAEMEEENDDND